MIYIPSANLSLSLSSFKSCESTDQTMSISFSAPDLQSTYNAIIDGSTDYDWAMFNQTGNELKVQETGSGLDELQEEFMDGRWVRNHTQRVDDCMILR